MLKFKRISVLYDYIMYTMYIRLDHNDALDLLEQTAITNTWRKKKVAGLLPLRQPEASLKIGVKGHSGGGVRCVLVLAR